MKNFVGKHFALCLVATWVLIMPAFAAFTGHTGWAIFLGIVLSLIAVVLKNKFDEQNALAMVCTMCGFHGVAKNNVRGSFLIELILWLCFAVPGLIYSIWRLSSKEKICSKCKNKSLIPIDTPMAQKLMAQKIN